MGKPKKKATSNIGDPLTITFHIPVNFFLILRSNNELPSFYFAKQEKILLPFCTFTIISWKKSFNSPEVERTHL